MKILSILLQTSSSDSFVYLVIAIFAFLLLFLILRAVMLWYWRVNHSIKIQQAQLFLLKILYEQQGGTLSATEKIEIEKIIKL